MSDLYGKTVVELRQLIGRGEVSSNEITSFFKNRIETLNKKLNAFLTINPAENSTKAIPMAIKDNFCTKGLRTTASSKVLDNYIPPYESTVTQKTQSSGFYTLGKTNMDAWAHGSSTETSAYGPTLNPWDLERVPGGSSGGSAAAVSAYLVPAAIGSETAGSIRLPAAWCGVVGMKPTYGRVSRYGVIAMGSSWDCPGTLTLSVEDAALILGKIAGKDPYDATSIDAPVDNFLEAIKEKRSYTIGIVEDYFDGIDDDVRKAIDKSIKVFEGLGHKIKRIKLMSPDYSISVYTILQRAEVSSNLGRYDGIRYGNNRSAFGNEAKKRSMLGAYVLAHGYYDQFYKRGQKVRTLIIEDFKKAFKEVDILLAPTTPGTALKLGESDKYPFFGELMDKLLEPASAAGLPAISIPCGLDSKEMPIGMQLVGNYLRESDVLNLAYQFEKETSYFGVIEKGLQKWK